MTPVANAVAAYRRAIAARGDQRVIVRRISGAAPNTARTDAKVGAIVMDYLPKTPVGGDAAAAAITLGARTVIVIAADLRAARFPLPLLKNDKIVLNPDAAQLGNGTAAGDEELNIMSVDANKRGVAGAIEIAAEGV